MGSWNQEVLFFCCGCIAGVQWVPWSSHGVYPHQERGQRAQLSLEAGLPGLAWRHPTETEGNNAQGMSLRHLIKVLVVILRKLTRWLFSIYARETVPNKLVEVIGNNI